MSTNNSAFANYAPMASQTPAVSSTSYPARVSATEALYNSLQATTYPPSVSKPQPVSSTSYPAPQAAYKPITQAAYKPTSATGADFAGFYVNAPTSATGAPGGFYVNAPSPPPGDFAGFYVKAPPTTTYAPLEKYCRREGYSHTEMNNIHFLENESINDIGHLFTKKPMLVMVKASWCGYCTKAAPAFQEFADKYGDKVLVGVIREGEGQTQSGKHLMTRLKSIMPTFKGFPHVVLYVDGKPVDDQLTDRSLAGLVKFVSKYVTL